MNEIEITQLYHRLMHGGMHEDIIVVEDNQRAPVMSEEYRTQYFYMGLCISGYMKGQYDYKDFHFKAGDICWLLPNHVMRHDEVSNDYSVLSVFVNTSCYQKLKQQGGLPLHYYPFLVTNISLDAQQFELMHQGYRMLGELAAYDHARRDELLCKMCDMLAIIGDDLILQKCPAIRKTQKHHLQLFESFYTDIVNHYRESHEVAYYAHRLSLTPKYFATVIKDSTGQSALQWINQHIMVQARWMLQHEYQKTVQQISNQLGFSEQASFSRFFRTHYGMTPTEYREQA